MLGNVIILIGIGAAVIITVLSILRWVYSKQLEQRIDARIYQILNKENNEEERKEEVS